MGEGIGANDTRGSAHPEDVIGDGERCGEARGFDPEQVHEARDAVLARTLDEKVPRGLALRLNFGPDTAIRGLQAAVFQTRPIAAYRVVEHPASARVDRVVDAFYPL